MQCKKLDDYTLLQEEVQVSSPSSQWINRPVLVVFSSSEDDPDLRTMRSQLSAWAETIRERGVLVISVVGMSVSIDGESTESFTPSELRRMLEIQTHGFALVLLGDEGSERTRRFESTDMQDLLAQLD